jgi:hypothetical protein
MITFLLILLMGLGVIVGSRFLLAWLLKYMFTSED